MQTTKRPTGLRTAAPDYETLVQQAINKVSGFKQLYKELERAINVSGKSKSTLINYSRQLAHLALHYNQLPTELDSEELLDYLHLVKSNGSPSATFFKFTVYGNSKSHRLLGIQQLQTGGCKKVLHKPSRHYLSLSLRNTATVSGATKMHISAYSNHSNTSTKAIST